MYFQSCDSVYYLVSQNQIAKYHEEAKNLVNLHLALFRFKAFETDILISFNDPVYIKLVKFKWNLIKWKRV